MPEPASPGAADSNVSYLFLVGAPKSGTTSLAKMLDQCPGVCVASVKEPRFFSHVSKKTWVGSGSETFVAAVPASHGDWLDLFAHKPGAGWRVDATTDYLSMPESAHLISDFADRVGRDRVLVAAILRDPVARAISEYQHTRRDAHQTESLGESLRLEARRIEQGYIPLFHHVRRSSYAESVQRYRELFGAQFMVLDYHRLEYSFSRLSAAMGLPKASLPESMVRANASYVTRSSVLKRVLRSHKVNRLLRLALGQKRKAALLSALERYNASGKVRVRARDIRRLRDALAEDIARCRADPDIATDHWNLACPPPRNR